MAGPEDAGGAQDSEAHHAAAAAAAAAAEPTAIDTDEVGQPAAEDGTPQRPGKDLAEDAAEPDGDPSSAPAARGKGRKARGALQAPA